MWCYGYNGRIWRKGRKVDFLKLFDSKRKIREKVHKILQNQDLIILNFKIFGNDVINIFRFEKWQKNMMM